MKVASFLPSFWDVFLLMSLPLTVTFRPNEQTHKVFSICATSQPFPAPNLMLFVVALKRSSGLWARWWVYRSWPITIHQCPPCGEIAMSHKNEFGCNGRGFFRCLSTLVYSNPYMFPAFSSTGTSVKLCRLGIWHWKWRLPKPAWPNLRSVFSTSIVGSESLRRWQVHCTSG